MDQTKPKYNRRVLMGGWFEENCEEEYQMAVYMKKRERKSLFTHQVKRVFENFLKAIQLPLPTKGVIYGGIIQLIAPDVPAFQIKRIDQKGDYGMTLAIALDTMEIDRTQNIKDGLELAASPLLCPYVRSTFYLESEDKGKMGQQILYGDRFFLRSTCRSDMPLYIHVTIPNLTGPVGRCGYPVPKLSPIKNYESTFTIIHPFSSKRFETEGTPVPPFEKVVILHATLGCALCVETNFWKDTIFSPECDVSIRSSFDRWKQFTAPNLWKIMIGQSS